ncbi:hypothetical protein DXG01_011224 [Tephrocybe rancida]|nr:hypothetical protein DXG01_011224 [Tephrocybe rancida]
MSVPPLKYSGLQIEDVTIELSTSSSKWIQSMDIQIDGANANGRVKQKVTPGTTRILTVVMEQPAVVVVSLHVTAHLRYKHFLKENWRSPKALISVQKLLSVQGRGAADRKEWRGTYDKLTVIVGLTTRVAHPKQRAFSDASGSVMNASLDHEERSLTPTTESILLECPRFRILVMGKLLVPKQLPQHSNRQTGVGKSRLINKTFGVDDAIVADTEAGFADIDNEIYSKANPHFILHDSKGFEHGDDVNVKIVQRFISERSKEPLIKDKLHAVWLCIDIPLAGGRLLESGIEQFLKLKIEGKLGHGMASSIFIGILALILLAVVPVIAVFTKYDLLVTHETRLLKKADREGKSKEAIAKLIEHNARTILDEICVQPFDSFVKMKVPHVTVSNAAPAEYGFEPSLSDLIQVTYDHVREYFVDASVVTAMAQRVNPRVNIHASIAYAPPAQPAHFRVGRRKYWERLATSVNFPGKKLQQCLDVIHTDIIAVWQFVDPQDHLSSSYFKALMSNIVAGEGGENRIQGGPARGLVAGVSLVAGIAGIVSVLAGPAAPIVIPIAASFVLAKWVYDMYQQTAVVLKLLMSYIIDLTLVLQNVFWLQALTGYGQPLSRRIIKAGARAYYESNAKQTILFKIDKHLNGLNFSVGPDATLNTIVELIESCIIDSAEMLEQRSDFPVSQDVAEDEAWDS